MKSWRFPSAPKSPIRPHWWRPRQDFWPLRSRDCFSSISKVIFSSHISIVISQPSRCNPLPTASSPIQFRQRRKVRVDGLCLDVNCRCADSGWYNRIGRSWKNRLLHRRHTIYLILFCYLWHMSALLFSTFLVGYVISDIYRSVKNGDLIRAADAAFDTSPYETIALVSAILLPPSICCYGDYFVPWRHQRSVWILLLILVKLFTNYVSYYFKRKMAVHSEPTNLEKQDRGGFTTQCRQ